MLPNTMYGILPLHLLFGNELIIAVAGDTIFSQITPGRALGARLPLRAGRALGTGITNTRNNDDYRSNKAKQDQ